MDIGQFRKLCCQIWAPLDPKPPRFEDPSTIISSVKLHLDVEAWAMLVRLELILQLKISSWKQRITVREFLAH